MPSKRRRRSSVAVTRRKSTSATSAIDEQPPKTPTTDLSAILSDNAQGEATLRRLNRESMLLRSELELSREKITDLKAEVALRTQQSMRKDGQIAILRENLEEEKERTQRFIVLLQEEVETLKQERDMLQEVTERGDYLGADTEALVSRLRQENQELRTARDVLTQQISNLQQAVHADQKEARIKGALTRAVLMSEFNEKVRQIQKREMVKATEEIQRTHKHTIEANWDLRQQLAQQAESIDVVLKRFDHLEETTIDAQHHMDQHAAEAEAARRDAVMATQREEYLQECTHKLENELRESIHRETIAQEALKETQERVYQLETDMESQESKYKLSQKQMKATIEKLEAEIEDLKLQLPKPPEEEAEPFDFDDYLARSGMQLSSIWSSGTGMRTRDFDALCQAASTTPML